MPRPVVVPPHLRERPVTTREAATAGVSPTVLRRRFRAMFHGVWWCGDPPEDLAVWLRAAVLALPDGCVVSHVTALRLLGIELGRLFPLHLSTRSAAQTRQRRLVLHRRRARIYTHEVDGFVTTSAERAFVDSATILSLRDLVRAGDALIHRGALTHERLLEFVMSCHLDGVLRARRAAVLVAEGVESFLETDVRLLLIFARLPVEACNRDIVDATGHVIARGDIIFGRYRVLSSTTAGTTSATPGNARRTTCAASGSRRPAGSSSS